MKMTALNGKEGVNICTEGEIEYQFQLNSTLGFCQEFKCVAKLYENSIWKIEKLGDINLQMDFIQVIKESEENNTIDDSVEIQNPLTNKQRFILTIKFRFPKIGLYKLEIVGRSLERNEELDFIAIYTVYVNVVHDWVVFFPKVEDIGWGPNPYLDKCGLEAISHKNGEIRCIVDQDLELKFRILPESKTTNITLRYKLREIITNYDNLELDKEEASKCEKVGEFRPMKNGIILVKLHIDRLSEMVLNISATLNKTDKGHVINYRIVAEKDPQQLLADFRGKLIEQLSENIKGTAIVQLVQILNTARASGLHRDIQVKDVFKTACTRYVHVKRYRECINKIARITGNDVAIIRAMHNPDDKLVRIIRTALVVLGEDRHKLDKWEHMQPLITLLEPNNLYRRIKKFNIVEAGNKRINMAKTILEDGDLKPIELVKLNQEAAAFGHWLQAVFEINELNP
ncbi:hypothetical protein DPMN_190578 [Dreissena polymorpha]|uniref:KY-like immunoglobulin-like domain-containing protein n=1 Tax=Dreissena polymorpha TaxID=45954 RepID=A0A9D4DUF4_DREPO|nr:hypothetical protein DPMN_190578 [Dreissena polymorpha]